MVATKAQGGQKVLIPCGAVAQISHLKLDTPAKNVKRFIMMGIHLSPGRLFSYSVDLEKRVRRNHPRRRRWLAANVVGF